MMTMFRTFTAVFMACLCSTVAGAELTVLTYHDIEANPGDDAYIVSRSDFVAQMDYLQTHDYKPVSLAFLERVAKKQAQLPNKAVLLTFDDGLKSYAQFVVPILKTYNYPSVLSVVTGWVDGKNIPEEYRGKLLSWKALRTLLKSPLVEIISHTHDLHTNVRANPQGNFTAAGVTRIYSPTTKQYESEREFRQRVATDLKNTVIRFKQELNIEPIGITWPYGRYDNVLSVEARLLGMKFQLTLDDGPNDESNFPILNRIMVMRDTELGDFVSDLNYEPYRTRSYRFVEISLDKFAGQSDREQNNLLSSLLDNVEDQEFNTVILSPVSKDGQQAFFPTRQLPVAADIMNRVSQQLNSRLSIRNIYLHLKSNFKSDNPEELYNDMARLAWFNGVVFDGQPLKQQEKIRKVVEYYHPKSKFGHFGITSQKEDYDFVILPVQVGQKHDELRQEILKAKGLPLKLFVQVKVDNQHSDALPEVLDTIRGLGILHYGTFYQNGFYGSRNEFSITKEMAKGTLAVFGG